jgi:hypothetical protein
MSYRLKVLLGCALLLLIDFIIYLSTLAPTVGFIDSGELAVVCQTLGIAHPTGYPLYAMLGRLFCLLPLGDTFFRVGFMSLVFTCVGNVVLFFILLTIPIIHTRRKHRGANLEIWAAFVASLTFSFTPTLWSQATSNEVYSLNVLLFAIIILLVASWQGGEGGSNTERVLYLLSFVYALSFGNHMSSVLLLPAMLYILVATYGGAIFRPGRLFFVVALFLLGLSVYLFLPIRSAQNPILDWGNPETWPNFVRHVSGWQYRVWMFAESAGELGKNLGNFVSLFFRQFPVYLLPLSLLGIWRLFVQNRRMLIFLGLLFLANVVYGINYGIPDIEPYFLGSFLANAVFLGAGLFWVFQFVRDLNIRKGVLFLVLSLFALLPASLARENYHQADRSSDFLAYDFACNIMRSAKKDAVIMTNVWDHYSPWLYLRFIESKRPDVDYLDTELCRRSWYFDYVKQSYGDLYSRSESEITRFLREVQPFENRQPYDGNLIEAAYVDMLNSFIIKNFRCRPLYDDLIGGPKVGQIFLRIPEGMVFSLRDSLGYYPYNFPQFELRGVLDRTLFKDQRTMFNLKRYPFMIDLRLRYLTDFQQENEADRLAKMYKAILSEPPQ